MLSNCLVFAKDTVPSPMSRALDPEGSPPDDEMDTNQPAFLNRSD